ncbi:Cgl0159 family (beta/alpha)8-fold protein [Flexivirga oryzae]|nr:deoxyribose-phosphate aldolase [Flexivirga oryzae]
MIADRWAARRRRPLLREDGRMLLVAADHPARGAFGVRGDASAMADRVDLLRRLVTALGCPGVDGVLGTADVLDDLLLLGALEGKIAIGSMNRGGLQGASFEFDDRFTGYTPELIAARGLEGGKTLTRICYDDPGTVATLEATGRVVTELAQRRLITMLEPFISVQDGGRVRNLLDPDNTILSINICAGLGADSSHTWLKVPVVDQMDRVLSATTLPTVLLGGDPQGDPEETYDSWRAALSMPAARGLVVGRALLYPPGGDVRAAVETAARMVHPEEAR